MIFLTVGTQFPFDRLVKAIDDFVSQSGLKQKVFAQVGNSSYQPRNFEFVRYLEKNEYDHTIKQASIVVSHAGMGSIIAAMSYQKPLLVVPRLKEYNEVVNNHQVAIARKFEQLGHILVAYQQEDLPAKIAELETFVPRQRKTNVEAVANRISKFLAEVGKAEKQS